MNDPIRFSEAAESPSPDEAETIAGLKAALQRILDTTACDYGHAVRSVHAKNHGVIAAELVVGALPPELAQGLFAREGRYPALMRISTNPGDILRDSIALPRGLAVKVLGVAGERLPDTPEDATQDFLLVNAPVFAAPTPADFLKSLTLVAATTDRAEWAKAALSHVLQTLSGALEAAGADAGALAALGGARNVHPLGETYQSQTAFRYGDHIARFRIVPVSAGLNALTGTVIDTRGDRDAIRHAVDAAMRETAAEWAFQVQLNRDLAAMPVEDPTVDWDAGQSPWQTVARLTAAPQGSGDAARRAAVDDTLRFSVWAGLAAHRPLGAVNRVRRETYLFSAAYRAAFNGCPIREPATLALKG